MSDLKQGTTVVVYSKNVYICNDMTVVNDVLDITAGLEVSVHQVFSRIGNCLRAAAILSANIAGGFLNVTR